MRFAACCIGVGLALVPATAAATADVARPKARIAFVHDASIWTMDADGKARRRLTSGDVAFTAPTMEWAPRWSRDGTRIAFERQRVGDEDSEPTPTRVWVMRADGTHEHAVLPEPGTRYWDHVGPWTAKGRLIFVRARYAKDGTYRDSTVYSVAPSGRHLHELVNTSKAVFAGLDLAPDGRRFLYSDDGGLWTMRVDGSQRRRIVRHGYDGRWSPDGRRIAFASLRDHFGRSCFVPGDCFWHGEIYVAKANGRDQARVTHTQDDEGAPAWSADGTRLAVQQDNGGFGEDQRSRILSMTVGGKCRVHLTGGPALSEMPDWRPFAGDDPRPASCG